MRKIYISLTGGLGNQLFQISAALAIANRDNVIVEWINSRPRLNSRGCPEIADFQLPENVSFMNVHKFNQLSSKAVGYLLRMGIVPRSYEKSKFFQQVVLVLASLLNVSTLRRYVRIGLNQGVGHFPEVAGRSNDSIHLIGYFQTYKWLLESGAHSSFLDMSVKERSRDLALLTELAKREEPLVLHMRFGDYRLESSFGLLTPNYYQESLRELWESGSYKSVWVFSDEINEARDYLKGIEISKIRYIPDVASSPAQTLEAMRLGKGYIIGNSSFSWWAAVLSRNQSAKVIAPTPWFIGQNEPLDLIPPHWVRRMGH